MKTSISCGPKIHSIRRLVVSLVIFVAGLTSAWPQAALEQQLRDPDPRVRERAARDIGNVGNTLYVPSLGALVQDPDEKVRLTAVRAVVRLGTDASLTPLT